MKPAEFRVHQESTHTNRYGEEITTTRAERDGTPVILLVVWDDPPHRGGSGLPAPPMTLDKGTAEWLRGVLDDYWSETAPEPLDRPEPGALQ